MQGNVKEWLVRTRTGEILGPFSQRELLEELQKRTFTVDDEIAPSLGHWISAQALGNREVEEFTHTSTRSQAFTRSIHTSTSQTQTPTPQTATDKLTRSEEELTPTPPDFDRPRFDASHRMGFEPPPVRKAKRGQREFGIPSRIAPLITLLFVLGGAWALISQVRSREKPQAAGIPAPASPQVAPGDSPFLKNIYELINRGETKAALQQLTQYHEKSAGKGGLDYLIPYSALLIMEGESLARARKFLEQVVEANTTAQLKAAAHHWLGYLLLSLGEGDAAETHFLDSLQLNTKDAASRFNLGRAYLMQGKYSPALDYFQLAELEKPDIWLIHIYKGRAKAELGNFDEARQSFLKAIACSPDRWISYMYYAVFQLIKLTDVEGAQITIKRMLTRDPKFEVNSPPPWGFFQEHVNYGEYLSAFNQIMSRGAGEEKELGKLYINYLNNSAQGHEGKKIEEVAEKGGLMSKVLALKVVLDRDATADEIKHAANRLPPALSDFSYYAYVLRGEARLRLGNFVEAQTDFKRAMELEPKSALAHFSMAVLLKRMQRADDAQNEMRDLLTHHPGYIPAIVFSRTF